MWSNDIPTAAPWQAAFGAAPAVHLVHMIAVKRLP